MTFSFLASNLTSSATLMLMASDSFNPNQTATNEITFSVQSSGVETNDCETSSETVSTDTTGELNATSVSLSNNIIKNALTNLDNSLATATGSGNLGEKIMFLIILLFLNGAFFIISIKEKVSQQVIFPSLLIIDTIALIIGVKLSLVSWGILILIALGGIFAIAIYIKNKFSGTTIQG